MQREVSNDLPKRKNLLTIVNRSLSALSSDAKVRYPPCKYDRSHQHLRQNNDELLYHVFPLHVSKESPGIVPIIIYL